MNIDFQNFRPENGHTSPTVRPREGRPKPESQFVDPRKALTARQIEFYRNLLAMSAELAGLRNTDPPRTLPVYFNILGKPHHLDHGCIKMAVNVGFLKPLKNHSHGVVREVELAL